MKKLTSDRIIIGTLVCCCLFFVALQILLFRDTRDTAFYLIQDLIFLPLNVLFVTFALNKILQEREKREKLEHINMLIGAFFGDSGTGIIETLNPYIEQIENVRALLNLDGNWDDAAFEKTARAIKTLALQARLDAKAIGVLKAALPPEKQTLLSMLGNANLLEHDSFTDLLWALYHLMDELQHRESPEDLPETDLSHLCGDAIRAYALLVYEWIIYMQNLKKKYPYLYSIEVRKNPFADNSIIVR